MIRKVHDLGYFPSSGPTRVSEIVDRIFLREIWKSSVSDCLMNEVECPPSSQF